MQIQYKIYEIDNSHGLKVKENLYDKKSERFVLLEPDEYNLSRNFDSFEEAIENLKSYGNDYVEYTIIPRIYLTR